MKNTSEMPAQHTVNNILINQDVTAPLLLVDHCDTLVKLFQDRAKRYANTISHREKTLGIWQASTWGDFHEKAEQVGLALHHLGLQRGEVVSVLAEDSLEWIYTDIAVQAMGGITSGVYTTDSAEQLAYLINDSQSTFLFIENEEQLDKYLSIRESTPSLKKVILYDNHGLHDFVDEAVITLEELYSLGQAAAKQQPELFAESIQQSQPEDTALLVYTSGTTGNPKGVAITHRNILFVISILQDTLPTKTGEEQLCFLPLSHIYERLTSVFLPIANRSIVNFTESPETVFDNLQEISPSIFSGVPRIYEKVYSRIQTIVSDATPVGQWAYKQAIDNGLACVEARHQGQSLSLGMRLKSWFWDWAVLSNLRRMLGFDRIRAAVTGAAPISPNLINWFNAIGVPLYEGFGMSETTATAIANYPGHVKVGTVGKLFKGSDIRIADDGEILIKSPGIFKEYWNNPQATQESFTSEGWFKTGDSGSLEGDFLTITGRIKDIIITAGGKNIAPAEIENQLKFNTFAIKQQS